MFGDYEELIMPEELLRQWELSRGSMAMQDLYSREGSIAYDLATQGDFNEMFELTRAVSRGPGDVLELASGSGRLTLPLAALGRKVTALDLSPEMLLILRERVAQLPESQRKNIETVEADMKSFQLGRTFGMVVIGATSITLLDAPARRELYRRVAEHLDTGGMFIVTIAQDTDYLDGHFSETRIPIDEAREALLIVSYYPKKGFRDVFLLVNNNATPEPMKIFHSRVHLFAQSALVAELIQAGFEIALTEPASLGLHEFSVSIISAKHGSKAYQVSP